MDFSRLTRRAVAAGALAIMSFGAAQAAPYPERKITLLVAFSPGGVADTIARLIGQGLQERLNQTVVVENRGGAGGNIAAGLVARAQPDGYTLLVTTTALAINETLRKNNPFKLDDFTTVAIAASSPEAIMTSPNNPAKDLPDLIKRANGKPITLGTAGVGSGSHVQAEFFFKELAKVPVTHVPFQGGAPAITAAMGGQIDALATTLGGGAATQIKSGKLKGLGLAAEKRADVTPDMPTYAEEGYSKDFTAASWVGVFAPSKTDPQIVAMLNKAIVETIKSDAVQKRLISIGFDPITLAQPEAAAMFTSEVAKWGHMVKTLGLSVN